MREGKIVRQRTIKALGRKDALIASGELDRLAASIARHSERGLILSDMEAGHIATRRIGGPLLCGTASLRIFWRGMTHCLNGNVTERGSLPHLKCYRRTPMPS
nr:hypothetical protein [Labrys miyagiensis]